ncbi:MFS transporter [Megamonas funiformis]|uniref:MFS transporter n=1 Tax=Megamonas funiformis TaxID=437897 RepID=UPI000E3EF3DD|nr:MFS transporter [Megamonas funiformis]RGJ98653.1 MFS transporter [Megamonas funiformis]
MAQQYSLNFKKLSERLAYGFGDFGCNIIYTAMSAFLLFYYTDYAGVSAFAVGTIMMVSRLFDGVSDIIMGVIVDRTKSKYGKARPWILRMCIPFAISGVLLFSVPTSWAETPKLIYVFITYNLVSTVVYTAINVPYSALNALMTQNPYERSVLSIFRNLLATAGTLTINIFTLPLVEFFGNNALAWTKTFFIFGIVAIIAFLYTFWGTSERVKSVAQLQSTENNDVPVLVGIKALFKNKYWIMMTGMLALFFLMYAINGGSTVYYAKDILGDKNLVGTINGIFNIVQICGMFFIAMMIKKFGKRNIFALGLVLDIIGMLILNYSNGAMSLIIISSIIRGLGNACGGATMWAMVSDTIDYGEWKTGYRTEGLVNSACSFGWKIGNGIGSALLGLILEAGGYVGTAITQTETALFSIEICFIWIPIAIYVIGLVIMSFYHLDKEFPAIIRDLNNRIIKQTTIK